MYTIRVSRDGETLEATFSGEVTTSEALRAVVQAFTLAEAGNISRALCDVGAIEAGPLPSVSVIAAAFATRCEPGQRIALLCSPEQLPQARKFARFAGVGEELGLFTRMDDAQSWLAAGPRQRLSPTALQHLVDPESGQEAAAAALREPPAWFRRRAG